MHDVPIPALTPRRKNSLPQGLLAVQSCIGKEEDIRANLAYGIIKARMPICVNRKIGIVDQS
jgi:hypothetical protein